MIGQLRGYPVKVVLPDAVSEERVDLLEAFGAEIIYSPGDLGTNGSVKMATEIAAQHPEWFMPFQYENKENPRAHYETTGPEIIRDMPDISAFVSGLGTGGTLTGTARRVKEAIPGVKIVGVDPVGSILAGPSAIGSYKIEGIGYDFIPNVLDAGLVDEWIKTEDGPSFRMARRLIRKEGLLVGGSTGSAVWAAVEVAKRVGPGKRIVTLAADGVRNYMTKFLDDGWMRQNGFTERSWESASVAELLRYLPRRELISADAGLTVAEAVRTMKAHGISQLPVLEEGRLIGILTESDVLGKLVDGRANLNSHVAEVMFRNVRTVQDSDDAATLTRVFADGMAAVVVDDNRIVIGLLTKLDLVDYLTKRPAT